MYVSPDGGDFSVETRGNLGKRYPLKRTRSGHIMLPVTGRGVPEIKRPRTSRQHLVQNEPRCKEVEVNHKKVRIQVPYDSHEEQQKVRSQVLPTFSP